MAAAMAKKKTQQAQARKGMEIAANDFAHLEKQLEELREKLSKFSKEHQAKIKKDPVFRNQFTQMCGSIGVDPLATSKNMWAAMSGVGDFYYELAVQAIEICMATRDQNGGLIDIDDLYRKMVQSRGPYKDPIAKPDLIQALKNLRVLGSGFQLITTGKRMLVQSIPSDMSADCGKIFSVAEEQGGAITVDALMLLENWSHQRATQILTEMLHSSQAWLDIDQEGRETYWFPSLCQG